MPSDAFRCLLRHVIGVGHLLLIASDRFRLLPTASDRFLLLPIASDCFRLLPIASDCFRSLPIARSRRGVGDLLLRSASW